MTERPIGRDVIARQRFARLFSLGDRRAPLSWSPGLVLGPDDPELPVSVAPLRSTRSYDSIPATITICTRDDLCYPFDSEDQWVAQEGLVLPPSLVESDSGVFGSGLEVVPVSWNSLHHDDSLAELDSEPSVIILIDAPQLAQRPGMLAEALQTVRIRFPSSLIWAPGISGPDNCALLAWMGVDLFDLARMRHASSLGVLLTESGPRKIEETVDEDFGMEAQCTTWVQAISSTRAAIREGTLRELVERQSMSSPRSVEHLRRHDSMVTENGNTHSVLSSVVSSNRRLRCHTYESRNDPLVLDWRSRVADEHLPPSHQRDILVLLPCSAKKPYKLSKSHIRFRRVLRNPCVHETMVTAPLGLVPRELEDLWPAAHYDIPVSGEWDADELDVIRSMVRRIVSRVGYSVVINHSGIRINIEGTNIIDTRQGDSAGSGEALSRLESAVESAVIDSEGKGAPVHARLEIMMSISRFIHGSDAWLKGASVIGRPPILTINKDGSQLAKWNPRLGRFSFSKSCLPMLDELGGLARVSLRDGVDWIGDIFSSNTESADCSIRSGDELLVFQGGKLIGSARSEAPGWEWPRGPGKLARARHRL